jgi:hypothetical protein
MRLFAFAALATAAASFAAAIYLTGPENWRPVQLPLPGPGLEVATPFEIMTAGNFRLEVQVPMQPGSSTQPLNSNAPRVSSNFHLTIEGPDGFRNDQSVTEFVGGSRYVWGNIEYYSAEPLALPQRGNYKFRLANLGQAGTFQERGAMAIFTRYQHSTEAYLESSLLRSLGWIMLCCGVGLAAWSEIKRHPRASSHVQDA